MTGPPPGWQARLAAVRAAERQPHPARDAWGVQWERWQQRGVNHGRTPNQAVTFAWRMTTDQLGDRPKPQTKETTR